MIDLIQCFDKLMKYLNLFIQILRIDIQLNKSVFIRLLSELTGGFCVS